jgi:capsular polysaccharide biosynthesis protein
MVPKMLTIIHKRAVVPEHPVSPNTFMNLLSAAGLGLLGFSVLAWPVVARMQGLFPTQPSP